MVPDAAPQGKKEPPRPGPGGLSRESRGPCGPAGGSGHCRRGGRAVGLPDSPGEERDPGLNVRPELPVQRFVGFGPGDRQLIPLSSLSIGRCKNPGAKL